MLYIVTGIIDLQEKKIVSERTNARNRAIVLWSKKMNGFTEKNLNLQISKDLLTDKE
jgi:hypothetical protein